MINRTTWAGFAALALLLTAVPAPAWDRAERSFGLGLELGDPTGLSAKYYVGERYALQGGMGFFGWPWGSGGHLDLLYEFPGAIRTKNESFDLPLFVGVGSKGGGYMFCTAAKAGVCDVDGFAGVRVPFGGALQLKHQPIEIQLELAPAFFAPFTYGWGVEVDLSMAARVYF